MKTLEHGEAAEASELAIEPQDDVLWLTIQRESRRNAINQAVLDGILKGLNHARGNPSVRAVVLTGAGSKAFCAGGDLQISDPFTIDRSNPYVAAADLFRRSPQLTVPLIARVTEAEVGGALSGQGSLRCPRKIP
jgi:enoyl-CoA hydratase/carnithine racemase